MLADLVAAFVMNALIMLVHLAATVLIAIVVRTFERPLRKKPYIFIMAAMFMMNTVLMTAHIVEAGIWACLYFYLNLTESFSNAFYSACIISTTLGLGDIAPALRTRLLMPLSAASGILMIGWSTALLIYLLQTFLPRSAKSE